MLEVCVEDARGIAAAVAGGAARIELCSALWVGGLTPSVGLIREAVDAPIPVHVLIRPRAGDFMYDARERRLIAADISGAVAAGAAGVVIGASRADATLDSVLLEELVRLALRAAEQRAQPLSLTLHRAFDLCPDPFAALESAVSLGFHR